MQVVYVLQISDDIDRPVAFATELHAKDQAAIAAHEGSCVLFPPGLAVTRGDVSRKRRCLSAAAHSRSQRPYSRHPWLSSAACHRAARDVAWR